MGKVIDLTGQRFGCWVVLAIHPERYRYGKKGGTSVLWLCRCDCGAERIVHGENLRHSSSTNCGCLRRDDLTGKRFGRWTVIAPHSERVRYGKTAYALWLCRCDCGTERVMLVSGLCSGNSRSCGCFMREEVRKRATTHGLSKSALYATWRGIKTRCHNPNSRVYHYYGGRDDGPPITLYERGHTFVNFYADIIAEIGDRPPGMSIDRIDNSRGYEPGNWRWATSAEQARNRRPAKRKRRRAKLEDIRAFAASLARAASEAHR